MAGGMQGNVAFYFSIDTYEAVQVMKDAKADDVTVPWVMGQRLCLLVKLAGLFSGDGDDPH